MAGPALLLVDVQVAFDDPRWGPRNNPDAEDNVARLLSAWRQTRAPVVHIRHLSPSPDGLFRGPATEFKPQAIPVDGEPVLEKCVNSAFIGTPLETLLRDGNVDDIVIAGLTTDHCCSTTARMAANLGFSTVFVEDATATFDREYPQGSVIDAETIHRTALASLSGEFAEILTTQQVIEGLTMRR